MVRSQKFNLLFFFFIIIDFSFSTTFIGIQQSRLDTDLILNLRMNVTSSNIQLNDGDAICSGLPLDINVSFDGSYSNPVNAMVPCPTFGCGPRPSVADSTPPFTILLINKTDFLSNVSYYYGTQYYQFGTSSNMFTRFNSTGIYYNPPPGGIKGSASFIHGLFCYGNISIYEDNLLSQSFNLNDSFYVSFTSSAKNIILNSSLLNCSIFIRTWETDGPMKDSVYISQFSPITKKLSISIYNGPSLVVTNKQTEYTVVPGRDITFRFTVNNTGDMDATITNVNITDGFTVNSFTPSTIKAGEIVDFSVSATAPDLPQGTQVSPTMSLNFTSTEPVIGSCGSASVTNFNVGTVTVGKIEPITVHIFASPSGFFNEGNTFIPSKLNITAHIWRDTPRNYRLDDVNSNITIYYYNISRNGWQIKFNVTDISGKSGSGITPDGRNYAWWSDSGGLYINLNETISSDHNYVPGIYKVEIKTYDDAVKDEQDKIKGDSKYFVIFSLTGCAKKV